MKGKITPLKIPENNHILWLPPKAHSTTLNVLRKGYSHIVKDFKIPNDYLKTIEEIKDSKLALEFADLAIKRIETQEKNLLKCLLKNYTYEKLKDHALFKDYELSEDSSLIHKNSKVEIFFEYQPTPLLLSSLGKIIDKFTAKKNIFQLAVVENDISLMVEVTKDIFKTVSIILNILTAEEAWYDKYLNFITEIVQFVKPEFQPDIIKQLADIGNFGTLSSFSEILLNNKQYEEVITLLEPRISSLINNEQEEESEVIYFCRYNLSLAYSYIRKLPLAEEQLLYILKNRPNDSDSIYRLFNIYIHTQKDEEAKNLIKNASKDLKILMEMSLDLPSISEIKLKEINPNNLSNKSKEQFRCFQYIAKYNSASEEIWNEENLKNELIKISKSITDNPSLSITALYTKQYELAKQFIKAISQDMITPYLNTLFNEIEFLLNPEEYIDQFYVENLVSNFTFSQAQAIEIINKVITCLIAIKRYS